MSKVEVKKRSSFTGHREGVYALESGNENDFYSAAGDGLIVQWNLNNPEDGELIARLPKSSYSLLFLKDKNQLVAAQNFSGIHLIDVTDKKEIASLGLTTSSIFDLKMNGHELLVATGDGQLIIVNIEEWQILKRIQVSEKSIRTIAVNPLSNEIALGSSDHKVRIYNSQDYSIKQEILAHSNSVFTLSYTTDLQSLISGSRDAHLKIWNAAEGYSLTKDIAAHLFAINDIRFSADGKHFATCSMDKSIKLWKTQGFELIKVIDKSRHAGHGTSVNKLLWAAREGILLSASDDRSISAWELLFL